MRRILTLLLPLLFATTVFAQFDWAADGVPVRQGLHLGWNGALTAAGDELALFYYHGQRDGTRDVWGQRLDDSGARRWAPDGLLVAANRSEQRYPVTAAYADGSTLVVWEDYRPGRYRDLYAQRYSGGGEAQWSPADGVPVVVADRDQFDPRLALDENGYAYIVFTDDRETTGINVHLGAYGQVLSPTGEAVGPADGIQLVDRLWGANVPLHVVAADGAGYVLISGVNVSVTDVILQKLESTGAVAWPDDPALYSLPDGSLPVISAIADGFALGFSDRTTDLDGDARLLLIDRERNPLPGWPSAGLLIAGGAQTQAVVKLLETSSGGDLAVATASYDYDANQSLTAIHRYSRAGAVIHAPVELGSAALGDSPLQLRRYPGGSELMLLWVARSDAYEFSARTQLLSVSGAKLWGAAGNLLAQRERKELRADLVTMSGGPVVTLATGRAVTHPESLWVGRLGSNGQWSTAPDLLAGGITYDAYDARVVRLRDDQALYLWTDNRDHLSRDLYIQLLDWRGQPRLAAQGQRMTYGDLTIQQAPAGCSDGADGAYIAWAGDSSGVYSVLRVQRLDGDGAQSWSAAATLRSQLGFVGDVRLLPDGAAGVYLVYSVYDQNYIVRTRVDYLRADGSRGWVESVDFDWPALYDMTLGDAVTDGAGGVFVVSSVGGWQDPQLRLFHLNRDGQPGTGWSLSGRSYGYVGVRDFSPRLLSHAGGALLCWMRQNSDLATGTPRAVRVNLDGSEPWGAVPRALIGEENIALRMQLVADGVGGFLLAWEDYGQSDYPLLRVQRFSAEGAALWAAGGVRACLHEGEQHGYALTTDSSGGAWVVWEDLRNSDDYPEWDLFATHLDASGNFATVNGFSWPADGEPMCDLPTYQQEVTLIPWARGSAMAVWKDLRSSNPGRCCGAGAVGDIFQNVYTQVLSEISLAADEPRADAQLPRDFAITQVYPNPFNPATTIRFELPAEARVRLAVYNTLGREVAVLRDGLTTAGRHELVWDAAELPSGLYFTKLESDSRVAVEKLLLLK